VQSGVVMHGSVSVEHNAEVEFSDISDPEAKLLKVADHLIKKGGGCLSLSRRL
jgi:hypothetical protein